MPDKITASEYIVDTSWAYAYGRPEMLGHIRSNPQDFLVKEIFDISPTGSGEHVLLQIRKISLTTHDVARAIARLANVKISDVGFGGMKDRNAVCEQWFSIYLAGKTEPDWSELNSDNIGVLSCHRHVRKLKRGSHKGNAFNIVVRCLKGDRRNLSERLDHIAQSGIPNYFGEQRFGNQGKNIDFAIKLFCGDIKVRDRYKRGIYLSSARSFLFNNVLSRRIEEGNWNILSQGDVAMLDGSRSQFPVEEMSADLKKRLEILDIHPTGPLWGRGGSVSDLENAVLRDWEVIRRGLEQAGLNQERRPLRVRVRDLEYDWLGDDGFQLKFALHRGAYATSVLRECVRYADS